MNDLNVTVKITKLSEVLPLRRDVLRPGYSLEESRFKSDLKEETIHIKASINNKIVGVATLHFHTPYAPSSKAYPPASVQLRGMAVSTQAQGLGVGKRLLYFINDQAQNERIWCNARKNAIPFYLKQGFMTFGEEFQIPTVGAHILMLGPSPLDS